MIKKIALVLLVAVSGIAIAQEEAPQKIYQKVDQEPEYEGGWDGMMKFVGETTVYPEEAKSKGIEGQVYVSFVVNEDGSVSDVSIIKGADDLLNNEALRVVNAMPNWKSPGMVNGAAVKTMMRVPFSFKLDQ